LFKENDRYSKGTTTNPEWSISNRWGAADVVVEPDSHLSNVALKFNLPQFQTAGEFPIQISDPGRSQKNLSASPRV
jgi:hypothetical protein